MKEVFIGSYFIGNIGNIFRVFAACPLVGGVSYRVIGDEFHTAEDAHLFLIELAKEQSDQSCKVTCVEVIKEYAFIGQPQQADNNDELSQ